MKPPASNPSKLFRPNSGLMRSAESGSQGARLSCRLRHVIAGRLRGTPVASRALRLSRGTKAHVQGTCPCRAGTRKPNQTGMARGTRPDVTKPIFCIFSLASFPSLPRATDQATSLPGEACGPGPQRRCQAKQCPSHPSQDGWPCIRTQDRVECMQAGAGRRQPSHRGPLTEGSQVAEVCMPGSRSSL